MTLTITLTDSASRLETDDVPVNEAALATGSNPSSTGVTDAVNTLAGSVTGGTGNYQYAIVGSETGSYGTIKLEQNGEYTYTLTKAATNTGANGGSATDSFTYRATDGNGNTVTGQIDVNIVDDVPVARADTKSGTEGGEVTGNVLTDGTPDAFGADGAASGGGIVGVRAVGVGSDVTSAASGSVGSVITGLYGTLILNADGRYTYDGNPDAVPERGATDVFVYTIRDGDGDLSTTTLTINLTDFGLKAETDRDGQVSEAALPTGSNPSSTGVTDAVNTLAGSVTGGTGNYQYAIVGSETGSYGTIKLEQNGEYTYTLTKAATNTGANGGSATDSFTYRATDGNGNTVTGQIDVNVLDDVPVARPDTNSGPEATISKNRSTSSSC